VDLNLPRQLGRDAAGNQYKFASSGSDEEENSLGGHEGKFCWITALKQGSKIQLTLAYEISHPANEELYGL